MRDCRGRDVGVGDTVAWAVTARRSGHLRIGKILEVHENGVTVEGKIKQGLGSDRFVLVEKAPPSDVVFDRQGLRIQTGVWYMSFAQHDSSTHRIGRVTGYDEYGDAVFIDQDGNRFTVDPEELSRWP